MRKCNKCVTFNLIEFIINLSFNMTIISIKNKKLDLKSQIHLPV